MNRPDENRTTESTGARTNLKKPGSLAPLVIVALLFAAAGVAAWFVLREKPPAPQPLPVAAAPEPVAKAAEPGASAPPLPPVAEADARVRGALKSLTALAPWLSVEDLARRFVAAVHAVAEGRSPRPSVTFLEVKGPFQVLERDGRAVIDPSSYARYDAIAGVFSALDPQTCASAFREIHPLFEAAHREIGRPGTSFDTVLQQAIDRLLATPVPQGELQVSSTELGYTLAQPELEGLSPAQKHLLRMGPQNVERIQAKLREISAALRLPEPATRQ